MTKSPNALPALFPWLRAMSSAANAGAWAAAAAAGAAATNGVDQFNTALLAAIGFGGAAGSLLTGEFIKHRLDDPVPVFDGPTTLLFDTAGTVIGLLLFFIPALQLDRALHPNTPVPGAFGFAALFLTAFLLPVLRGLLCNLGLVQPEREEPRTRV